MGLFTWGTKDAQQAMAETSKKKVLIGVAGFHGVQPEVQEAFFEMAYHCGRRCPEYDFFLKILIKREQFRARNNIVDLALINECDYLLMLDDDMVVTPDLFTRLVAHDKDVCGCLYYQRGGAYHPVLMRQYDKQEGLKAIQFINHFDPMIIKPGLHKIDGVIGGGCMLFKTDVFRKIPQPYFWIDGIVGTDVHVCNQLREAGIDIWVDTSIELGHLGDPKIITSRTVPQYSIKIGEVSEGLWNDLKAYFMENETEMESAIIRAAAGNTREVMWNIAPRDTWAGVLDYYRSGKDWHVRNLACYNLRYDQARDWAINMCPAKPGEHIVDFGAGLGYCTIPLAEKGVRVTAVDLSGTPTLTFLRYRLKERHLESAVEVLGHDTPVPPDLPSPADGVLMISVFDHLWDVTGILDWLDRNVKPGGWWLCDSINSLKKDDEPQHVIRYDPHKIGKDLKRRGWRVTPENPYLFIKET